MIDSAPASDDAPEALTPLETAFLMYRDEGLRLPPVPHEMAPDLARLGPWHFGTNAPNLPALDDRAAWADSLRDATAKPHVHFGHAGHGAASWVMLYSLVLDTLAVYLRLPYGNAHRNTAAARVRFNAAILTIEELVILAGDARDAGRLHAGERVVIVEDHVAPGSGYAVGSLWTDTAAALSTAHTALRR